MWTVTTYVLLPGAGGAAWIWHRVVQRLEAAGHAAVPIDLPADDESAGLAEYAALTLHAVTGLDDVVLVAQSLGGFTAPLVARDLVGSGRRLRAVVLVNAMVPVPGETPGEWWDNVGLDAARRAAAERGGWPVELDLDAYFLHDLEPEIVEQLGAHARNEAEAVFGSVCDIRAWPDVPTRVVAGADDRFFPADLQSRVARERLGVEADVLPGGHLLPLSHPAELTAYLLAV